MARPFSTSEKVFDAAILTKTQALGKDFAVCPTKVVEISTNGFSGTLDMQGGLASGVAKANLSYMQLQVAGIPASVVAQISYTTETSVKRYLILEPYEEIDFVMTRTLGDISIHVYGFGGFSSYPFDVAAAIDLDVPAADSSANVEMRDVVGNKADAAVTVVDSVSSLMGYLKGLVGTLGVAAVEDVIIPLGPIGNAVIQRDVDSSVRYAVQLVNLGSDILTDAETVPGTFTVHRVRAGTDTEIHAAIASTELNGVISAIIDFTIGTNWDEGDLGYIEFTGITVTPTGSGITNSLPVMRKGFRISQEQDIEGKIDTIDEFHDVPAVDNALNAQINEVIGNKADAGAAGAVTATDTLVAYIKQLVTEQIVIDEFHDVPAIDATFNSQINEVLGNKADAAQEVVGTTRSLIGYVKGILAKWLVPTVDSTANADIGDVIGNKTDAQQQTVGTTRSIMGYLKGVLTAFLVSSADGTANVDVTDVVGNKADTTNTTIGTTSSIMRYVKGILSRVDVLLSSRATQTSVDTIDAFHDVPVADVADNVVMSDVVGNKSDAAVTTVGVVASVIAYVKGLLNRIGAPAGASVSADILVIKNLVDSTETVGSFSLVNDTNEQDVVEELATTRRRVALEFELNAMTQDGTIRVFRKVNGTNYRLYTETAFTASGSIKVFDAQFVTNQDWKLTYQATVAEGAARSIPFNTITEVIE